MKLKTLFTIDGVSVPRYDLEQAIVSIPDEILTAFFERSLGLLYDGEQTGTRFFIRSIDVDDVTHNHYLHHMFEEIPYDDDSYYDRWDVDMYTSIMEMMRQFLENHGFPGVKYEIIKYRPLTYATVVLQVERTAKNMTGAPILFSREIPELEKINQALFYGMPVQIFTEYELYPDSSAVQFRYLLEEEIDPDPTNISEWNTRMIDVMTGMAINLITVQTRLMKFMHKFHRELVPDTAIAVSMDSNYSRSFMAQPIDEWVRVEDLGGYVK